MNCYVYKHIRLDNNEIFYIGIGNNIDGKYLRAYCEDRNEIWQNIVDKTNYKVEIIFENLTYDEACLKEKELIKLYGRKDLGTGTLSNLTDGGEGQINMSQYTKNKISNTLKGNVPWNKGKKTPKDVKKKMSEAKLGKKLSKKAKEAISKGRIGKNHSEKTKKKIGKIHKGKIISKSVRLKISKSLKGKPWSLNRRNAQRI